MTPASATFSNLGGHGIVGYAFTQTITTPYDKPPCRFTVITTFGPPGL